MRPTTTSWPTQTQCDWLREIGFEQVDMYFKIPELAIFGGVKGER